MFKNTLEIAFKKLLGKGRAFTTPKGFMSDFLDLIVSPFSELKTRFINLKYTHFPTKNLNKDDIINGEELFAIQDIAGKTLEERAADVENQWSGFIGCHTYQQIEILLRNKGFPIRIIENIPEEYNRYGARLIGNGFLVCGNSKNDPIIYRNGKHSFIIQVEEFMTKERFEALVETLVKSKPAQNVAFVVSRFLRKKEIHKVLTKQQMQKYKKNQYCDCRPLEFDKIYQ